MYVYFNFDFDAVYRMVGHVSMSPLFFFVEAVYLWAGASSGSLRHMTCHSDTLPEPIEVEVSVGDDYLYKYPLSSKISDR